MPAERHSRPLHKVGPPLRDCQGRAHRGYCITSEESAAARHAVHPKGRFAVATTDPGVSRLFDGPLRDAGLPLQNASSLYPTSVIVML
jgi:hypothetical protein